MTGVGVTPAVDQLVIVADHAQVPVRSGEQVDQGRLCVACVLELVRQKPSPPLPQPRQPVRVLVDQPDRAGEQVVELERVAASLARTAQAASQITALYDRFGPDRPWGFADPSAWKCSARFCDAWGRCPGGGGL